ncbi:MAG: hypothetical protein QOI25_1346 [Mycobacterium sp.]|jgi:hypothetical protein|nr:hypothetical protein [Mycobacterium sp.]
MSNIPISGVVPSLCTSVRSALRNPCRVPSDVGEDLLRPGLCVRLVESSPRQPEAALRGRVVESEPVASMSGQGR